MNKVYHNSSKVFYRYLCAMSFHQNHKQSQACSKEVFQADNNSLNGKLFEGKVLQMQPILSQHPVLKLNFSVLKSM